LSLITLFLNDFYLIIRNKNRHLKNRAPTQCRNVYLRS